MSGSATRGVVGGLIAVVALALPAAGGATVFDIGKPENVGTFKVLGGHLRQTVAYLANYEDDSADGCWMYHYSDTGGAKYRLSFDRGETDRWRWNGEDFPLSLFATGTAARSWSGSVSSTPLKEDRDDCGGPSPLTDNGSACGSKKVESERAGFHFVPVHKGRLALAGDDLAPFGPIFKRDPFPASGTAHCPSDSVYGSLVIPAITKNGMKRLDEARIGETIELGGSADESGPGPTGFATIGEWVEGSHTAAEIDWKLDLKRVKPRK